MYRKVQSIADVVISTPMLLQDGTQATSLNVSSFSVDILRHDGASISDFTNPTITNPVSKGEYVLAFPTSANSAAFTLVNEPNPYTVVLDHPETDVEPMSMEVWITDRYEWELAKEIITTDTVVIPEDVNRIPRIEATDTYRFERNFVTEPLSVEAAIYAPDNTLVASGITVTQSTDLVTHFFDHTTTTSWYTTVDSSGMFFVQWTAVRSIGNDIERDYFEVVRTD